MDLSRTVEQLYAAARWFIDVERPHEAAAIFRFMVLVAPADDRGWLGLGVCHEKLDQAVVALEMYGLGRSLAAPSARCEIAAARVLRQLSRDDEAREAHERAIRLTSEDAELRAIVLADGGAA